MNKCIQGFAYLSFTLLGHLVLNDFAGKVQATVGSEDGCRKTCHIPVDLVSNLKGEIEEGTLSLLVWRLGGIGGCHFDVLGYSGLESCNKLKIFWKYGRFVCTDEKKYIYIEELYDEILVYLEQYFQLPEPWNFKICNQR